MRLAAAGACAIALICLDALPSYADNRVASVKNKLAENLPAGAQASSNQEEEWLTSAEYQRQFDRMVSQQHYPRVVEARLFGEELRFKAEFSPFPKGDFSFYSSHAMTPDEFARQDRINRARGYRLLHRQSVKTKDTEFIQATWVPKWFQN